MRTIDLGALSAGVHTFSWDAKQADGTSAPRSIVRTTLPL
ncbi:FlgD immunoglobulin-like domain containing protein [Franconibacter helveticus]